MLPSLGVTVDTCIEGRLTAHAGWSICLKRESGGGGTRESQCYLYLVSLLGVLVCTLGHEFVSVGTDGGVLVSLAYARSSVGYVSSMVS